MLLYRQPNPREHQGEAIPHWARPPLLFVGLCAAFAFPVMPVSVSVLVLLTTKLGVDWYVAWHSVAICYSISSALVILLIVTFGERRSIRSLGFRGFSGMDFGYGLATFIAIEVATKMISSPTSTFAVVAARMQPNGGQEFFEQLPLWHRLAGAVVMSFAEEVCTRGYALERIETILESTWLAGLMVWTLSTVPHILFWGWRATVTIAPGEALFVILYLKKRSIAPCIIAHVLTDTYAEIWSLLPSAIRW